MVTDEKLLSGPAAIEAVTGRRPHYSTYFRWTQLGFKAADGRRIRLAFVKAGSRRLTNVASVREFFAAITAAASSGIKVGTGSTSPADDLAQQVEEALDREGLSS